jgi:hypothetical protein
MPLRRNKVFGAPVTWTRPTSAAGQLLPTCSSFPAHATLAGCTREVVSLSARYFKIFYINLSIDKLFEKWKRIGRWSSDDMMLWVERIQNRDVVEWWEE